MRCPRCGTENPDNANYCHECGGSLAAQVPSASASVGGQSGSRGGRRKKKTPSAAEPEPAKEPQAEEASAGADKTPEEPRQYTHSMQTSVYSVPSQQPQSESGDGEMAKEPDASAADATGAPSQAGEPPQSNADYSSKETPSETTGSEEPGSQQPAEKADETKSQFKGWKEERFFDVEERGVLISRILQAIGVILVLLILYLLFKNFTGSGALVSSKPTSVSGGVPASTSSVQPLQKALDPTNGTSYMGDIYYDASTNLTGDIATSNAIIVGANATLTTNGHNIVAGTLFVNQGRLITGYPNDNASLSANGKSYPKSYGGSGGVGGGGGGTINAGATPKAPVLNSGMINAMWLNGTVPFLTGAGGGGGCKSGGIGGNGGSTLAKGGAYQNAYGGCDGSGSVGGSGSYGIMIQANTIVAGNMSATGQSSSAGNPDCGGGGGGGAILLVYMSGGYTAGTYGVSGGVSACDGAQGGSGQVILYPYNSAPPITVQ